LSGAGKDISDQRDQQPEWSVGVPI